MTSNLKYSNERQKSTFMLTHKSKYWMKGKN